MSALLCSRPNNVVSGIVAGLGNTTGAVLVAVGKRCHMLILLNYANTSYPPAVFAEYFRKIPGTCTKTCTLQNKLWNVFYAANILHYSAWFSIFCPVKMRWPHEVFESIILSYDIRNIPMILFYISLICNLITYS